MADSQLSLVGDAVARIASISAEELITKLGGYRLPVTEEDAMQRAIALALEQEGIAFRREVTRGRDRIDFVVGRVGIECKVHCSVSALSRQLLRYALWDDLDELLVITPEGRHRLVPNVLNGKPVRVHVVRGVMF
jgi:hypothetical protein